MIERKHNRSSDTVSVKEIADAADMMVAGYLRRTITDFYSCKRNDIISLCVLKQNNK